MLRNAGVKKIHMRIASPPVKFPCFMELILSNEKELLASRFTIKEIKEYIGVDSLKFISLDGIYKALGYKKKEETKKIQNLLIIILAEIIQLNLLIKNQDLYLHNYHYSLKQSNVSFW